MVTPANFNPSHKYPMILEIHGGPYAAYGSAWSSEDQLYSPRLAMWSSTPIHAGSTSYGQAFADGILANYPGYDFDDLMSVVDAAIAKGSIDPTNLFVTGGSGGGLLTAWIVGKTDRFKAAASQKPVINWTSWGLTTDISLVGTGYWFSKAAVAGSGGILEPFALVPRGERQDANTQCWSVRRIIAPRPARRSSSTRRYRSPMSQPRLYAFQGRRTVDSPIGHPNWRRRMQRFWLGSEDTTWRRHRADNGTSSVHRPSIKHGRGLR